MDIIFKHEKPLYIELYLALEDMINKGILKPDTKMPSKRLLSIDLDISLNTVMEAYEMLKDEGYIYTIEKKGYFVQRQPSLSIKPKSKEIVINNDINYKYDFTTKSIREFDNKSLNKIVKDLLNDNSYLNKSPMLGDNSLKDAIKDHLKNNRGIDVLSSNIIITSGMEGLKNVLDLIDINTIYLENPGYHKIKDIVSNKNIKYISLDNKGVLVPNEKCILYTTSFNQFPLGIRMTVDRKKELIEFANKTSSFIIEDDFDTEFRINSKPVIPLYKFDSNHTIFFSSFSTTMFPGLRISYIVLPNDLLKLYIDKYKNESNPVSTLMQLSLAKYIDEGLYARSCNKIKRLYLNKRTKLINELLKYKIFKPDEKKNYISLLVDLKLNIDIDKLISYLKDNSINIKSIKDYDINKKNSNTLILGYTNISYDEIDDAVLYLYNKINEYVCKKEA